VAVEADFFVVPRNLVTRIIPFLGIAIKAGSDGYIQFNVGCAHLIQNCFPCHQLNK
jgi:hypothetical protein